MAFYHRTRSSSSIVRTLLRSKRWHLVPLYYLLMTSSLAREAIENGGSHRFTDRIYRRKASGRFIIGALIDWLLLSLPSARALRARYLFAKKELKTLLLANKSRELHVLVTPSGYAREILETATELRARKLHIHLLDIDPPLLQEARHIYRHLPNVHFWCGDALLRKTYFRMRKMDCILTMGLTEYLGNDDAIRFFQLLSSKLKKNGRLITSALQRHPFTDYLLRNLAELHCHYRSQEEIVRFLNAAGLRPLRSYQDDTKLQAIVIAR